MEKGKTQYGFDVREIFNLDSTFLAWVYERLKYMIEETSTIIDYNYHKFEINGEQRTQLWCMKKMLEDCEFLLYYDVIFSMDEEEQLKRDEKADKIKDEFFIIFSKIFWYMWW